MQPSLFDGDRPVLHVRELARRLKDAIAAGFDDIWVEGELSDFRQYRSGHCYFTLKDADAQLRGVMWRGFTQYLFFTPQDGMLVRVHGSVDFYEKRGEVQIVARSMQLAGEGALQKAFEALKTKLAAEGLFDARHKRALPPFPETVGVITSGDGAALHDVLSILQRRFPQVRVLVCPVRVQGLGAADEIAEAVAAFDALPPGDPLRPDVLIVGRGGGSAEDLWAFNEEAVARAVFASGIPVVSAVGHETDYSIADFVADVRAATPSMAAELVVPDHRDVAAVVRSLHAALRDDLRQRIVAHRRQVEALTHSRNFSRPLDLLQTQNRRLDELTTRLHRAVAQTVAAHRQHADALALRLDLLDPQRPLRQGYARVMRNGQGIRKAADLVPGDRITLHFADGEQTAQIE